MIEDFIKWIFGTGLTAVEPSTVRSVKPVFTKAVSKSTL